MKSLGEYYRNLSDGAQALVTFLSVALGVTTFFVLMLVAIKTSVGYLKSSSYESTSDLTVMDCKDRLHWLKNNTDSTSLFMFADDGEERWSAEAQIGGQKLETRNAKTACSALNALVPVVNGFIESTIIAEQGVEE